MVELVSRDEIQPGNFIHPRPGESSGYYRWTDAKNGPIRLRLFQFPFEALLQHLESSMQAHATRRIQEYTAPRGARSPLRRFGWT